MKLGDKTKLTSKEFIAAGRLEFAFLAEAHGFTDSTAPAESADQLVFDKQGWKIEIQRGSYGTRVSILITSPEGHSGQFIHLIDWNSAIRLRPEFPSGPRGDVSFLAHCLEKYGKAMLDGDWREFEILRQRQMTWVVPSA